jgi:hypothetical protein
VLHPASLFFGSLAQNAVAAMSSPQLPPVRCPLVSYSSTLDKITSYCRAWANVLL